MTWKPSKANPRDKTHHCIGAGCVFCLRQREMEGVQKQLGAVCGNCGKTVTANEYTKGESNCCKADVTAEELFGKQ